MERLLWVTTKGLPGQPPVTRLVLNPAQRRVHEAILRQRAAGHPARVIILKARQPGISTLAAGYQAAALLTQPYASGMVIAHLDDAAIKLFQKTLFMLQRLPEDFRPTVASDRRTEILLDRLPCQDGDVMLRTLLMVGTASGQQLWRGLTLQTVHASEFAYFPRPEESLIGMLQAVPKTPQSLVMLESTANGIGNVFHDEYVRAEAGESGFTPVFIPWFDLVENRMIVPRDFVLEPEERELKRAFGLDDEQLQWRRYTLFTQCRGNTDLFAQEYPGTAAEAFLVTGRPAFPVKILRSMWERAAEAPAPRRGVLTEDGKFIEMARGPLAIYRMPERDHDYAIGADPSAGVEGGDYGAIQVIDRDRGEQVALWHGYLSPVPFARLCVALGRLYNTAVLAPEINNHGLCLHGDTIVHSPEGDWPVRDLVGKQPLVYGWFDGRLCLARATRVWLSQSRAECVRVRFRWQPGRCPMREDALLCTPSHPVMLLSGEFRRAADLQPGDRLMPFLQDIERPGRNPSPRMRVLVSQDPRRWDLRARFVWQHFHGPAPEGWDVHHEDGNAFNDAPENLGCLPHSEHMANHCRGWPAEQEQRRVRHLGGTWQDPAVRARRIAGMLAAHARRRAARVQEQLNHRVVAVESVPGEHDVYDLEVPGLHHFAAAGIFVHNSVVEECKANQYPRLYVWQRVDKVRNSITNWYGWQCVDPDAKVLTVDLRWARAGDVEVGDRLLGCHERVTGGKGSGAPLRAQTVVANDVFVAPRIEVVTVEGQRTVVSATHPFLVYRPSRKDVAWRWQPAERLRPGDFLRGLPMWGTLRSYEAGRLSAFLDGEGHLSRGCARGGYTLLVTQAEGLLAEEICELWKTLGFDAVVKRVKHKQRPHKPIVTVGVLRLVEVLRALGSLRPTRLLRRFEDFAEAEFCTLRALRRLTVQSVRRVGEGPVVGLTTDPDHTLIADGIVGHNTTLRTRPLMIDSLVYALNEAELLLVDPLTIDEALKFQWTTNVRAEGEQFDDAIMALMIAYRAHLEMPLLKTGAPPRVKFGDVKEVAAPTSPFSGIMGSVNHEAWQETDQVLEHMERTGAMPMHDFEVHDPERYPEEPLHGLDKMPDILY